jgi:ABC-type multidrug transport system permease subunit
VQVSVFSVISYFFIHFDIDAGKFFFFWLANLLSSMTYTYLGMVMVCVTPNLQMGITVGATTLGIWFIFAGFMIPRPDMPVWWRWTAYVTPPYWTMYAVAADQLGDKVLPFSCTTYIS